MALSHELRRKLDLELRLWINQPASGVVTVRSAVLLGMWDRFKEHGVQIPLPQRTLHLKDANVGVTLNPRRRGAAV